MSEKQALTCREVCRLTGLGRTKVNEEMREGRLRARKVGSRTLILAEDLDAWLESLPSRPIHPSKFGRRND